MSFLRRNFDRKKNKELFEWVSVSENELGLCLIEYKALGILCGF